MTFCLTQIKLRRKKGGKKEKVTLPYEDHQPPQAYSSQRRGEINIQ